MSLLNLLLVIVVVGVILGGINAFLPMAPIIKSLLNIVVVVMLIVFILESFKIIPMVMPIPDYLNYFH